jgi:hypothetical protein
VICYDRPLVEHILPAVWDSEAAYGMKAEQVPDADMPRGHKDPKKGSPLFVHIADIKQAWKRTDLSSIERQSLVLRYGLDYSYEEIGGLRGVQKSGAQRATERAVGKVTAWLNGDKYIDGYDQLEADTSE